jgi:hypothetical protein
LLMACCKCGVYSPMSKSKELTGIRLISSFPLQDTTGNVVQTDDVLSMFKFRNHILYQIRISNTEIKNDKVIQAWVTYQYLIHQEDKTFGLLLEADSVRAARVNIDSFLRTSTITDFNSFYRNTKWNDSLIGRENLRGNIVRLKFVPKRKLDESYNDTTLLYFSRALRDIDYALSRDLDDEYRMKFFKIRLVYNGDPKNEHQYFRSRREIMFGMERADLRDTQEILKQFRLFETFNKASIEGK